MILERANIKIDPDLFRKLVELISEVEWLKNESTAIAELWNICESDSEENLIIDLIKRIKYLKSEDLRRIGNEITKIIVETWNFSSDNTFIFAISEDSEADGSQFLLQNLKNRFAGIPNWKERNFKNSIGKVKEINNNSNVILLDDFIGTGKTMLRKIDWVQKYLSESGKTKIQLKVIAVAGMNFGIQKIKEKEIDFFIPISLNKGITDFYQGTELKSALNSMESMESRLAPKYNKKKLRDFRFGYKQSEALFGIESCSVPNNVFPIFWWKTLKNGKKWNTLFDRL